MKLPRFLKVTLSPNTTDVLQPMDIAVNKPTKNLKRKFEEWYSNEVLKQLQGVSNVETAEIQPLNLSMSVKEITTKWLVDMFEYIYRHAAQS